MPKTLQTEKGYLVPRLSRDGDRHIVYLGDDPLGFVRRQKPRCVAAQRKAKKHWQFLDADKFNWAEKLHVAIGRSLRRKDGSMDEVDGPRAASPVARRPRRQFKS